MVIDAQTLEVRHSVTLGPRSDGWGHPDSGASHRRVTGALPFLNRGPAETGLRRGRQMPQLNFSKTIVAWIRSPPPKPLLFAEAVVIVCSR